MPNLLKPFTHAFYLSLTPLELFVRILASLTASLVCYLKPFSLQPVQKPKTIFPWSINSQELPSADEMLLNTSNLLASASWSVFAFHDYRIKVRVMVGRGIYSQSPEMLLDVDLLRVRWFR